jgi:hypothetical protein
MWLYYANLCHWQWWALVPIDGVYLSMVSWQYQWTSTDLEACSFHPLLQISVPKTEYFWRKFVWHVCYCFITCFSFQNVSWVSTFQLKLVFQDTLDKNSFVNLCCEFCVPNPSFAFCSGDTMPICLSLSHNHTYIEREFHFALWMLWVCMFS